MKFACHISAPKSFVIVVIQSFLLISLVSVFFFRMPVKADYVPQSSSTLNLSSEFGVSWAGDDVAYAMTPIDSENSTVLAGYTTSFGAGGSDVWLVKVTSRLNFLNGQPWFYRYMVDWRKTYGGAQDDGAKSVIQAGDGCYTIAGYTKSYGAGGFDMYLVKVDSDGNLLWNRTYGGSQDDGANCIVQASDGGYIIAGYTNSGVQSQSAWLVKTDSSGQVQWNRTVPGMEVNSIIRTSDGGYVLATKYFTGFELVKLDSSCQVQWNQTYIGPDNSAAESAIQTNDGGYAIAGWENVSQTSTSARLIKTDSSGNVQWDQTYAGLGAYALIQTSSGGYALTGDRAFLIITNSSGHVQWNRNYDALSEDNLHFTRTYYIAEPSSNQFVMAGTQQSYGQILTGLDGRMISITLRYAADTTPEPTPAPTSTPEPTPTPEPTSTPSPTPTPTPSPPQATPTIDVSCRGTTSSGGFKVEINGKLSFNEAAISGESVLISYSVTGGSSWESLTLVNTGSEGGFLAVWTPSVTGNYLVKTKWEGNSTFNEASTIVNLALTPSSEENVFSVTSNSTISEFAFNSTSKELSFTASGPSGTTGYVSVYIPKSLMSVISDLKVYVDGDLITYNSESQLDSWVVSFSYSHSVHKVIIDLSATSSEISETSIELISYIAIIAVVTAIAVSMVVFRRKRQHIKSGHSS